MTRTGAYVIGVISGIALCLGLMYARDTEQTARIKAADAALDSAKVVADSIAAVNDSLRLEQASHDGTADRASAVAEQVVNTLGARILKLPLPAVRQTGAGVDSGLYVPLADFMKVKSSWESERTARSFYRDFTVPGLEEEILSLHRVIAKADTALAARDDRIDALERQQKLYVLGAIGTVIVLVIALR